MGEGGPQAHVDDNAACGSAEVYILYFDPIHSFLVRSLLRVRVVRRQGGAHKTCSRMLEHLSVVTCVCDLCV